MQVRVTTQVTIIAQPTDVFAYLADLKRHFLWNPHLQSVSSSSFLQPGFTYKSSSLLLGIRVSGVNRVVKILPERRLEIENSTGTLRYKVSYELRRRQDKTRVTCTTQVVTDSQAFAFTAPVLKILARRELQADLQALKIAVEQRLE